MPLVQIRSIFRNLDASGFVVIRWHAPFCTQLGLENGMTIYRGARAWTYFGDTRVADSYDCEVRFGQDDGSIAVSYESDSGRCLWLGSENGDGHYVLGCEELRGRASLHRFGDGLVLTGYWEESGERGMWRIELEEPSDSVIGLEDEEESLDDWGDEPEDELDRLLRRSMKRHTATLSDGTAVRFRLPADLNDGDLLRIVRYLSELGSDCDD